MQSEDSISPNESSNPPVDPKGSKRFKHVLQQAGVKKVDLRDNQIADIILETFHEEFRSVENNLPRKRRVVPAEKPMHLRKKPTVTRDKRAGAFTIPWMKLNTGNTNLKRKIKADISVGTKVRAQYIDGQWLEAKIVMVSDAIVGVKYGVVFKEDAQVYQLSRDKIRTLEEVKKTAEIADKLIHLDKDQMKRLTHRLSVTVNDYRKSMEKIEESSESDWSDWSTGGSRVSDSSDEEEGDVDEIPCEETDKEEERDDKSPKEAQQQTTHDDKTSEEKAVKTEEVEEKKAAKEISSHISLTPLSTSPSSTFIQRPTTPAPSFPLVKHFSNRNPVSTNSMNSPSLHAPSSHGSTPLMSRGNTPHVSRGNTPYASCGSTPQASPPISPRCCPEERLQKIPSGLSLHKEKSASIIKEKEITRLSKSESKLLFRKSTPNRATRQLRNREQLMNSEEAEKRLALDGSEDLDKHFSEREQNSSQLDALISPRSQKGKARREQKKLKVKSINTVTKKVNLPTTESKESSRKIGLQVAIRMSSNESPHRFPLLTSSPRSPASGSLPESAEGTPRGVDDARLSGEVNRAKLLKQGVLRNVQGTTQIT